MINPIDTILPRSKNGYSYEELRQIEQRRRAILTLNEDPFCKILFHWDGTVFRQIAFDPLFWITMVIYVVIRALAHQKKGNSFTDLGNADMNIVGGFLTFFLVFYVNQNHSSYFGLYEQSMKCKGRIFDAATLASASLPKARATRLVRYMNAAHVACYVGLSEVYTESSFFSHINKELSLLTEEELERMKRIGVDRGGRCSRELLLWCMKDVEEAKEDGLLEPVLANELRTLVLRLGGSIGSLYNSADQPCPFFYLHFICLLTAIFLPLFAASTAVNAGSPDKDEFHWTKDVIGGLVVLLQSIFVIGLRVLGQQMSDPYGDDLIDLSVIHYVKFTWINSNRILESPYIPVPVSVRVEHELATENRKRLGSAWEKQGTDEEEGGSALTERGWHGFTI